MSEGRRSKRLSKKDPIDYSDTKRISISSPNRYSALDQDIEEESIVFYPDTQVANDDEEDWIITGATMTEETRTKEIDLGLTPEELLPNNEAALLDILKFIRLLANKAAMVGIERTGLGLYADLVETEKAYQERVGKEFKSMPTAPTRPERPEQQAGQSVLAYQIAQDQYKKKTKVYLEYQAVVKALKKAIQAKFPLLSDGFQGSEFGRLPADQTPGEILQVMAERSVTSKADRERLAMELEITMMELSYTPNRNGPIQYLKTLRENRALANEVTKENRINEERLMNYAVRAFEDCGHDRTQIGRLKADWDKERLQSPKIGKELVIAFETHWCRELRNLYQLEGMNHQANLTFDVESVHNRFDEIEHDRCQEFQALRAELQALKAQVNSPAKQDVPSVVTTPTVSTNSNPNDGLMAMMAGLVAALQQNQTQAIPAPKAGNNPRNQGQQRTGRQFEWRKVDKWCWHCGANTSHISIDCKSKDTKAPEHPDATKDKPEGGNTEKNKNWGLWYHPKKGYRETKPGN